MTQIGTWQQFKLKGKGQRMDLFYIFQIRTIRNSNAIAYWYKCLIKNSISVVFKFSWNTII